MKDKTCAAYVCAFLLLAVCAAAFGLRKEEEPVKPLENTDFEQTAEPVPERDNRGVELAELPKPEEKDGGGAEDEQNKPEQKTEVRAEIDLNKTAAEKIKETESEKDEAAELISELPALKEAPPAVHGGTTDPSMQEQLVREVFETASVQSKDGQLVVCYEQPEIPPEYHLTVKAEVYDRKGATVCRYVSDAGWLADPSRYDASEKSVLAAMGAGDLKDKMFILVVKAGDANLSVGATVWQLTQNYDGTQTVDKVYVQ